MVARQATDPSPLRAGEIASGTINVATWTRRYALHVAARRSGQPNAREAGRVNCSNCGTVAAPDAGFCRNCGAFFRGKGATATLVPTAPASGPIPPANGPEPPSPPLADAGFFAPPQAWHGSAASESESATLGRLRQPSGGTAAPASAFGGPASATGLPPGAQTVATFSPNGPMGFPVVTITDARRDRHLHTLDLAAVLGTVAVLGSLFMSWYQYSASAQGISISVSVTALHYPAGGLWRWLMLVLSIGVIVEVAVNALLLKSRQRPEWPHPGLLAVLCIADLALVVGSMIDSPFAGSIGAFQPSLGSGAYVGLAGALVGTFTALGRLFVGPPALSR